MEPPTIRADDRCLFLGRTGSGKTTLADNLIRSIGYRTAVIDPKRRWDFPGYKLVTKYDRSPYLIRQVFRPLDDVQTDWADLRRFLEDVWDAGIPTVVYIDELTRCSTTYRTPPILADFVRLGRQAGMGTWTATQRPKDIHSLFLTEAEHWFVFDLRYRADREKAVGFLGEQVLDRPRERYAFWYANAEMADPVMVHQQVIKPQRVTTPISEAA
jgi:energy-coupling factor transporter ATP-binding protein EcfA2